jgi:hypothetical protein
MSATLDHRARQIELDVSDAERHAYTVSTLDADGAHIDIVDVYGRHWNARRGAERLARKTGLPVVTRYIHPGLDPFCHE